MTIPALILARGGSKGIPGKNLKEVGGVSLLGHCVNVAMRSRLAPVFVWSDDPDIRAEGEAHGATCPPRHGRFATDSITSEASVAAFLKKHGSKDWEGLALLQCTTPFLTAEALDECVRKFQEGKRDAVVTVSDATQRYFGYPQRGNGKSEFVPMRPYRALRQEEAMSLYMENGACYLAKLDLWISGRRLGRNNGVVVMPWWDGLEIDEPDDLAVAEVLAPLRRPQEQQPVRFVHEEVPQ